MTISDEKEEAAAIDDCIHGLSRVCAKLFERLRGRSLVDDSAARDLSRKRTLPPLEGSTASIGDFNALGGSLIEGTYRERCTAGIEEAHL
jgi:hypothetical protein